MDTLKDKLPVIGIGLAAIAIAGYIVFGLDKGEKKPSAPAPAINQVEPSVEVRMTEKVGIEFHFVPADLPNSSKIELIQEWLKRQITSLL